MSAHSHLPTPARPAPRPHPASPRPDDLYGPGSRLTQLYGPPSQQKLSGPNYTSLYASFGCLTLVLVSLVLLAGLYFFSPGPLRILLLGTDRAPDGGAVSRTDTIIFMQIDPSQPDTRLLSIPRDLWVSIPDVGENRINTAHFFAEANQAGSGPQAVVATVADNFGLRATYYARIQFDGFIEIIDTLGGLDLTLEKPLGGLPEGQHHLSGVQALAFARDRKGTDDFSRMNQGQVVLKATIAQILKPQSWPRLPALLSAVQRVVKTDIPGWLWLRIGLALLRSSASGFYQQTLTREMVTPYTTSGGAQVLLPNWEVINPFIQEFFGN